jgi:hypothetical protein
VFTNSPHAGNNSVKIFNSNPFKSSGVTFTKQLTQMASTSVINFTEKGFCANVFQTLQKLFSMTALFVLQSGDKNTHRQSADHHTQLQIMSTNWANQFVTPVRVRAIEMTCCSYLSLSLSHKAAISIVTGAIRLFYKRRQNRNKTTASVTNVILCNFTFGFVLM